MIVERNDILAVQEVLLCGIKVFYIGVPCKLVQKFSATLDYLECFRVYSGRPDVSEALYLIYDLETALSLCFHLLQCL
jgi:hypothetical protein